MKLKRIAEAGVAMILALTLLFAAGCKKEEEKGTPAKKQEAVQKEEPDDNEVPADQTAPISYTAGTDTITNHPYNMRSYYYDECTYIKRGNTICRILDGGDEWEEIYASPDAAGLGFTIYGDKIYAYVLHADETGTVTSTEIVRVSPGGMDKDSILTLNGMAAGISGGQGNLYLQMWGTAEGTRYIGYKINEDQTLTELPNDAAFLYEKVNANFADPTNSAGTSNAVLEPSFTMDHYNGVFYQKSQGLELPGRDVSFESAVSLENMFSYTGSILVTPNGFYKVSENGAGIVYKGFGDDTEKEVYTRESDGAVLQLFTYDEARAYFCSFQEDGTGMIGSISFSDGNVSTLLPLQDLGIAVPGQNADNSEIYMNVQNGYLYIWTAGSDEVIRQTLEV